MRRLSHVLCLRNIRHDFTRRIAGASKTLKCKSGFILILFFLVNAARAQYSVSFPEGDYAPQYSDSTGVMAGFLPDLVRRFSDQSGYDLKLISLPIKRYQLLLKSGQLDFILPSNPAWTDKQVGDITFSSVIMISRSGFLRKKGSLERPIKNLATVRGYTLPQVNPAFKDSNYKESFTINTSATLEMLRRDYVDTVYAHLDFVKSWLRRNHLKDYLVFVPDLGYDDYSYHLATLKHPKIIAVFNQWMLDNAAEIKSLMKLHDVGHESLID
ncbi:MAG: hypothetical protein C9356_00030 [Oleiphilus sp.]|nr:MAG: hypothetical protein C9356_00030 [Oleiphilus sp.]